MTPTVEALATQTERAFAVFTKRDQRVSSRQILAPESANGGFIITFGQGAGQVVVQYLDMEFVVRSGGREIFGAQHHPSFSGNMFSPEHLAEHLERLAQVAHRDLVGGPSGAA